MRPGPFKDRMLLGQVVAYTYTRTCIALTEQDVGSVA